MNSLKLNIKKTKYMVVSKNAMDDNGVNVGKEPLHKVERITYLGSIVNDK